MNVQIVSTPDWMVKLSTPVARRCSGVGRRGCLEFTGRVIEIPSRGNDLIQVVSGPAAKEMNCTCRCR